MAAATRSLCETIVPGYRLDPVPDLSQQAVRERLTPDAIKVFGNIMHEWSLTERQARQLLGEVASSTYHAWRTRPEKQILDQDKLMRISLVIGIYKALHIYFGESLADRWITLPNRGPLFASGTPLQYMIQAGQPGMVNVRRMLDAWCAGN